MTWIHIPWPCRFQTIGFNWSWADQCQPIKCAARRCPMERDAWKAAVLTKILQSTPYNKKQGESLLNIFTEYPKKYAHGFCFAVLCCGYTLTDFPISIRLTSLALWQSNDCPSASKATLMNMDKCFMWIHYERLHNHNKAKHNKTVCIFLGIYCITL